MKRNTPTEELFEIAFGLAYFSKKMLKRMHAQHKITEVPFAKVPVFYTPAFDEKDSDLLKIGVIRILWNNLDPVHGIQDPVCLFKSNKDGYSLAMLRRVVINTWEGSSGQREKMLLLVFKTSNGAVFGAFLHLEKKSISSISKKQQQHKVCRSRDDDELHQWPKKPSSSELGYIRLGVHTFLFTIEPSTKIYKCIPNGIARSKATLQHQNFYQEEVTDDSVHVGIRRRSSRESFPLMAKKMHSRSVSQPPGTSRCKQQNVLSSSTKSRNENSIDISPISKSAKEDSGHMVEVKMEVKKDQDTTDDKHHSQHHHQYGGKHSADDMIESVKSMWIEFSESRLAFGAPNETALFIDDKLHHGFTEACSLFGSPPLSSSSFNIRRGKEKQQFKCVVVEAWGLTR
eukprot:CAMPEP_0185276654 /NCGR_PEP_ID=MMETSP1359-20130426/56654_1 /TAXON_ID=552665 /ORGANISM="Bigelowiella longifila, Strain CCMP242" /LENGTH=399 /DNA_ID=CAMNT_0027870405 /DNA_START=197 /DNA_END=1396 /DNA_ORIENTATION=-